MTHTATLYNSTLDRIDTLSNLVAKLKPLADGPLTNYPSIISRFQQILDRFKTETVGETRTAINAEFDQMVNGAFTVIGSGQTECIDKLIQQVNANDAAAPVLPVPFDRFHKPRSVVENESPDLLYMLLLRPTNQTSFGNIDRSVLQVLNELNNKINFFISRMERVKVSTTTQVLAEIKYDIEALLNSPPEDQLRQWLASLSICCGGRAHKQVMTVLSQATAQAERVRADGWYPNLFDTVSKLPMASGLFGKHDAELLLSMQTTKARLAKLSSLQCENVPPYLAQLLAEFGYMVSEATTSVSALLSVRSLFIKTYNVVQQSLVK